MSEILVMRDRIDLTSKSTWQPDNYDTIAKYFGFSHDDAFKEAIKGFVDTTVIPAKMTDFLAPLAQGFLASHQPPLTRSNSRE